MNEESANERGEGLGGSLDVLKSLNNEGGNAQVPEAKQDMVLAVMDKIKNSGMGKTNRYLYINTEWEVFLAPVIYEEDDGGESIKMLCQRLWFDLRALEKGGIVKKYASDGWLSDGIGLEWKETWCLHMRCACYDEDLVIHRVCAL